MFAIDCPSHGRQVLVTDRRIRSLANTDHGIVIDVECWCGTHVTLVTGRAAGPESARTLTPAA